MTFTFCLLCLAGLSDASMFLGKVPVHLEHNHELEHALLSELEVSLGNHHRTFTEKRLGAIKKVVQPIFAALTKNEHGKLGRAATSYALYRIFVARHAWFVVGLEPFKSMSTWSDSSPTAMLDEQVPDFITGLFSTSMGKNGFGVHEVAVLAATLEHFVHKESLVRVNAAYRALGRSAEDVLSDEEVEAVMDTYMTLFVLGPLVGNVSTVSTKWVQTLRANVTTLYPGFSETQQFLRDVQQSVAPKRDYFYYSDVASLVEEVGDRYGRWQDHECRTLKDNLVEMEDQSTGGAGRVRLADFYNAALNHGKWQFSENVDYLRQLGALDESNPDNLRVIISNYVNGPSNCVASSNYYSVCCINECDELLGHIETKVAGPDASPEKILALVASQPSSTVSGNRTLAPWLTQRLQEVADHHGGLVPLHGRLFGQWMHYAFPRECPFPHVLGATQPQTAEAWVRETQREFSANSTEMTRYISLPVPQQKKAVETGKVEDVLAMESPMWTMEEELVVCREGVPSQQGATSALGSWIRGLMFFGAIMSGSLALVRTMSAPKHAFQCNEKHFV